MRAIPFIILFTLLLALTPDSAWRAAGPSDGRDHQRPAVAVADDGRAVLVWSGFDGATGSFEIMAQRYSAAGAEAGPPFRVNGYSAGSQRRPAVAIAPSGDFVVVWDGPGSGQAPGGGGQSGSQRIWGRVFTANGAPRTDDFAITSTQADGQRSASVAMARNGDFVVVWGGVVPGDGDGVAFARFTLNGVALGAGDERPYSLPEADSQTNPAVAVDRLGAFSVAWESVAAGATSYRLLARSYNATGAALGAPFELRPAAATPLCDPALAMGATGGLQAVWAERDAAETQGAIWLRRLSLAGAPLTTALEISPPVAADRYGPAVAVLATGELATIWADATSVDGGAPVGVVMRLLSSAGAAQGEQIYPGRPPSAGFAAVSSVAMAAGGGVLLVAWDSDAVPAGGGLPVSSVYLRRYAEPPASRLYLPMLKR